MVANIITKTLRRAALSKTSAKIAGSVFYQFALAVERSAGRRATKLARQRMDRDRARVLELLDTAVAASVDSVEASWPKLPPPPPVTVPAVPQVSIRWEECLLEDCPLTCCPDPKPEHDCG